MALTKEQVLKIADLARLDLSDADVEKYGSQLSSILKYVETLDSLDVSGIEPTAHAVSVSTPFREDVAIADETLEKSLRNAPDQEAPFFKVPKVL